MTNLIKKVQNFASLNHLWEKDSKIVLGVSGGPDSACLLDIMAKVSRKYSMKLHIAHVNYGLRGKDSDKDEQFVEKLAEKYGLGLSILSPIIKKKSNLEEELRIIRYAFFEKIRKELKFDYIAVAHTADDQAETVLMRIIRGTGLSGLRAMRCKNGVIIRPLLSVSRSEIEKYLAENKLASRLDKTNMEEKFFRNKIRHNLIPYLQKNFNSSIKESLLSLSITAADDFDYISKQAKKTAEKIIEKKDEELIFSTTIYRALHPAIQREFLRLIIKNMKRDLRDIESANIEEARKILASEKNKIQKMNFKGLKLTRKGDTVTLSLIK